MCNYCFDSWLDTAVPEMVADLQTLARIPSVAKPGDGGFAMGTACATCADALIEIGCRMGFEVENDDYYCVSFILPGTGSGECAVLGHMDVVPEGDGWNYPPFGATREGEWIIGRGVSDNKGPCIMSIYALKFIKEQFGPQFKTIRLIFGFQEESGMNDIRHYIKTHPVLPDFTLICDGCWPAIIGEKGMLRATLRLSLEEPILLDLHGGIAFNSVPDTAQALVTGLFPQQEQALTELGFTCTHIEGNILLTARGIAAHAAFPNGSVNAIGVLLTGLLKAKIFSPSTATRLQRILPLFCSHDGSLLGIANEDEISGPTTCVVGTASLSGKELSFTIDVRSAVSVDFEALKTTLCKNCVLLGLDIALLESSHPRYTDPTSPIPQKLIKMANEYYNLNLPPIVMGGGTHARVLPNSLPFGPSFSDQNSPYPPSPYGGAHRADESVNIRYLAEALPLYVKALCWLSNLSNISEEHTNEP